MLISVCVQCVIATNCAGARTNSSCLGHMIEVARCWFEAQAVLVVLLALRCDSAQLGSLVSCVLLRLAEFSLQRRCEVCRFRLAVCHCMLSGCPCRCFSFLTQSRNAISHSVLDYQNMNLANKSATWQLQCACVSMFLLCKIICCILLGCCICLCPKPGNAVFYKFKI